MNTLSSGWIKLMVVLLTAGGMVGLSASMALHQAEGEANLKPLAGVWDPGAMAEKQPRLDHHGDPLPEGALARLGTIRWLNPGGFQAFAGYVQDNKRLVIVSKNGKVRLLDSTTGKELQTWKLSKEINGGGLSPDERFVVLAGVGGDIDLLDLSNGKIRLVVAAKAEAHQVAFAPDGRSIFVHLRKEKPRTERLVQYGLEDGKERASFQLQPELQEELRDFAVANDGKVVHAAAVPAREAKANLPEEERRLVRWLEWNLDTGKTNSAWFSGPDPKEVKEKRGLFERAAFPHSPNRAVVVTKQGTAVAWSTFGGVWLWDVKSNTARNVLKTNEGMSGGAGGSATERLLLSPDATKLAVQRVGSAPDVTIVDLVNDKTYQSNWYSGDLVGQLCFSRDGNLLASVGRRIWQWDVKAGAVRSTGIIGAMDKVVWSSESKKVCGWNKSLGRFTWWNSSDGKEERNWDTKNFPGKVLFTSGGEQVLVIGRSDSESSHVVQCCDGKSGRELRRFEVQEARPGATIYEWALSPDGKILAAIDLTQTVLWDVTTGKKIQRIERHPGGNYQLVFSPDGRWVAGSASDDKLRTRWVSIWDIKRGEPCFQMEGPTESDQSWSRWPIDLVYSPNGRFLAALFAKQVILYEAASGRQQLELPLQTTKTWQPYCLAFSPSGRLLAVGGGTRFRSDENGDIKLLDVTRGNIVAILKGHSLPITSLAFHPQGDQLVSSSEDSTALIWSVPSDLPSVLPPR
jgi:WD40 repeat protein